MHEVKTSFPGVYQQKQVRPGAKESRRGGWNNGCGAKLHGLLSAPGQDR